MLLTLRLSLSENPRVRVNAQILQLFLR